MHENAMHWEVCWVRIEDKFTMLTWPLAGVGRLGRLTMSEMSLIYEDGNSDFVTHVWGTAHPPAIPSRYF